VSVTCRSYVVLKFLTRFCGVSFTRTLEGTTPSRQAAPSAFSHAVSVGGNSAERLFLLIPSALSLSLSLLFSPAQDRDKRTPGYDACAIGDALPRISDLYWTFSLLQEPPCEQAREMWERRPAGDYLVVQTSTCVRPCRKTALAPHAKCTNPS
jgi:hypothetical protein